MNDIKQYVICHAHPLPHVYWPEVLLIEKKKPEWQAGRYNLPGGKIEPGETPHEAAKRELFEECGIECELDDIKLLGEIEGEGWVVYVMDCRYNSLFGLNVIETKTNEHVFWLPIADAFRRPQLIDNLRIIIPLCRSGLMGWTITESQSGLLVGVSP